MYLRPVTVDAPYRFGIAVSSIAHVLMFLLFLFGGFSMGGEIPPEVIYSVTLEGGKQLGGRTQVPEKEDSKMAPPKAAEQSQKEEKQEEVVKEKEKKKEPEVKPEEAEVSLNQKPTPVPTKKAEPTAAPKSTSKPSEAKPTVAPVATAKPKTPTKQEANQQYENALQRYLGESVSAGGEGFGAARVGGNGMGGGVLESPEFIRYRENLRQHIRQRWNWFEPRSRFTAVVSFDLSPEGRISGITLERSSGNSEFDSSCMRAMQRSDPAPIPPVAVYSKFKRPRITFDPKDLM